MKKFSKVLCGLLSAIAIGSIAIVPMDASALAKLLGYDSNGNEIYGGYYDELVGFDDDGNPIIINTDPSITIATAAPPLPEVEQTTEEAQVTTVVEEVNKSNINENEFIIGDSTFPRGDINLDGKVTTVDLLMLKKYLLGLMEW